MGVRVKCHACSSQLKNPLLGPMSHQEHAGNTKGSFFGSGFWTCAVGEQGGRDYPGEGSALNCCHPWILAVLQRPCADYHTGPGENPWLTPLLRESTRQGTTVLSNLLKTTGEVNGCRLLIALCLFYTLCICLWVCLEVGLLLLSGGVCIRELSWIFKLAPRA